MLKNKIRKLLALVLAGVMITGMEIPVHAATVWTGGVDTSWYTGNKSSYDISTPEQLAGFAKLVRDAAHEDRFRGVTINLTDDIILNDTSSIAAWSKNAPANVWDPIGRIGSPVMGYCPFAGCFNGNGHTISGWWPQERPVPRRVPRGPLGIALPSMPGPKTLCGVGPGT